MWSRRHFANAKPAGIIILQNLFAQTRRPAVAPETVINNLAAVALPARRLAYGKLHATH